MGFETKDEKFFAVCALFVILDLVLGTILNLQKLVLPSGLKNQLYENN